MHCRLKADPRTENIPVLILTARTGEDSMNQGLNLGADDFMMKPFSVAELRTRVASKLKISEIRKESNRREILRVQAERDNQTKDLFLASLSHELRTPIAPVLLLIEDMIMDDVTPVMHKEKLRMMTNNVQIEIQLIDDLLDITKMNRNRTMIQMQRVNMYELVNHSIFNLAKNSAERKQMIKFECENKEIFTIADPVRIQQVFWNLIGNAIKFSSEGSAIIVKLYSIEASIFVSVRDMCDGLSRSNIDKMFLPFEQGIGRSHRLGLCKSFAVMHGGDLMVKSEGAGQGCTFTLRLPLTDTESTSPKAPSTTKQLDPSVWRVLLVEDDKMTMMVMERILRQRLGFSNLRTADSVKQALKVRDVEADHVMMTSNPRWPKSLISTFSSATLVSRTARDMTSSRI